MITFKVDKVDKVEINPINTEYLQKNNNRITKKLVGLGVESSSVSEDDFASTTNNLLAAINTAYDQHLPLTLSPDMNWLTIAQGLSLHINNNAEQLRHHFVNFEGKKELHVQENSFVKGSSSNNWSHMFGEFSKQIADYIGKKRDLIINNFSTTGPVELASSEIVLMEAMSKYFNYSCVTACGIPEITLLGTTQDWKDILVKIQNIAEFDLSWWTPHLETVIQEFIDASQDKINTEFWSNIYKENSMSGGPFISGWITTLFPYIKNHSTHDFDKRNMFAHNKYCYTTKSFPMGLSKVPFKWNYYSTVYNMELTAGFSGFQMKENSVVPQIGWFVRDTESMVDIKTTFKSQNNFLKNQELANSYLEQLKKLGFESDGTYGNIIVGSIPVDNLKYIKKISGLSIEKDSIK